ncbi:MAG: DUF5706 domain-containing protein [Cyclobacteriaceae bacterium]|nr:DUF5706 domain-containing protein [Cyclobacteriaceae bacterium]
MLQEQVKTEKTKKKQAQGIQTLFRVSSRTQIGLIRIADYKANMIMGINAMIITVLVGIIGREFIFSTENIETELYLIIPLVQIILTALFTLVYAIRAVKPRLLKFKKVKIDPDKKLYQLCVFFTKGRNLDIWIDRWSYIGKMENLIKSPTDIYQNMIIDIHSQAKVLHRKYKMLSYAYTIFMIGMIISIVTFLVIWWFTYYIL